MTEGVGVCLMEGLREHNATKRVNMRGNVQTIMAVLTQC